MKNAVYKNASIVTGLSVAERGLGFLYRVVLSRLVGAEGLGIYQVALSLFALFSTVSSGGIPITLSRTLAKTNAQKDERGSREACAAALLLSLCIALPLCLFLWLFGRNLHFLFLDGDNFEVLRILLIGLCFSCVYAVIRGSFWGNKQFLTASLLEAAEEIFMVVFGVFLLRDASSPLDGAKRAAWALVLANILAAFLATLCFFLAGRRLSSPKNALKPLFNATLPVTSVRVSGSLVNSAVALLLPVALIRTGLSEREATSLFGIVTGIVLPVLLIPSTLIGSLSLVLVPELSADFAQKNQRRLRKNIIRGLSFASLVACALIPFFFVLGEEIGRLAFSNAQAGELISKSCFILLPMSLAMISSSMLNSIGFEKQTCTFFFLGSAALLLCILVLPALVGVYAYPIGLGVHYTLTALCNLLFLRKACPFLPSLFSRALRLFLPFVAILPLSLFGQFCLSLCHRTVGGAFCLLATALCMAAATFLLYSWLLPWKLTRFFRKRKKRRDFA